MDFPQIAWEEEFTHSFSPFLTDEGRRRIVNAIWDTVGNPLHPIEFYDSFLRGFTDWSLVNRQGKIAKRIAKYMHERGWDMPDDLKARIGTLANEHSTPSLDVIIKFTRDLMWERGMFNDGDSCFWTQYWMARPTIKESGRGGAIHIFEDNDERTPILRAFIVPLIMDGWVIFNAYSNQPQLQLRDVAIMLGDMTGEEYSDINLDLGEAIYVNNNTGYLIGTDAIASLTSVDIALRRREDVEYSPHVCDECGVRLHPDDRHYGNGRDYGGGSDPVYCQSCYDALHDRCVMCGYTYMRNTMQNFTFVIGTGGNEHTHTGYTCRGCSNTIRNNTGDVRGPF